MNFCPNCGQRVHPQANFCGNCGAKLSEYTDGAAVPSPAPARPAPQPQPQPQPSQPQPSQPNQPGQPAQPGQPPKKKPAGAGGVVRSESDVRVYKDKYIEAMDKLEQESGKFIGGISGNEETGEEYKDFSAIDLSDARIDIEEAHHPQPEEAEDREVEDALKSASSISRSDLEEEVGAVVNCPMCGKETMLSQKVLHYRPLRLTCRKCGNEWMIR